MRFIAMAAALMTLSLSSLANQNLRPDVQVNVPPEVFSSGGQRAAALITSAALSGSELFRRGGN